MKSNAAENKRINFNRSCDALPILISNYKSGNFDLLSDICFRLNSIVEYVESDIYHDSFQLLSHYREFSEYLKETYAQRIFLVLKEAKAYSYTPKNIIKFIRGEGKAHGSSNLKKEKRLLLYDFIHEENARSKPELEFAITWNWIIYPGIKSDKGNTDSSTPFVHRIKINNIELQLTAIESVVLSIALDFHNILSLGQMSWVGRIAITNNFNAFRESFGDKIVDNLISQEKWILEKTKCKDI
jgi:hypothetical protein